MLLNIKKETAFIGTALIRADSNKALKPLYAENRAALEGRVEALSPVEEIARNSFQLAKMDDYTREQEGEIDDQAYLKQLFDLNRALYLKHKEGIRESKDTVNYEVFEAEVTRILAFYGFLDTDIFWQVDELLKGYKEKVTEELFENPIVRSYLLRKTKEIKFDDSCTHIAITSLERKLLLKLKYETRWNGIPCDVVTEMRLAPSGSVELMFEQGATPHREIAWNSVLYTKFRSLKERRAQTYNNLHFIKGNSFSMESFARELVAIRDEKREDFELQEGVNFILGTAGTEIAWRADVAHAFTLLGVVCKERDSKTIPFVVVIDSNDRSSDFSKDLAKVQGKELRGVLDKSTSFLWTAVPVQIEPEDGGCSYYTQAFVRGFKRMYAQHKSDLDKLVKDSKLSDPMSLLAFGLFIEERMPFFLPAFYDIVQGQEEASASAASQPRTVLKPWNNPEKPLESRRIELIKMRLELERKIIELMLLSYGFESI